MEVVTADGRALRASAADNPDLYWALRGGGGNFGVVTAFTYRLHPITPQLYGGTLTYAYQDAPTARRLLRGYAEIMGHAPDELGADVALAVDRETQQRIVEFDVCYCGPLADAERVVAPLRKLGKPLKDAPRPGAVHQAAGER